MAERRKGRGIDDRDVAVKTHVKRAARADGEAARREREERRRAESYARARGRL